MDAFDLTLGLEGTHVLITGAAGQIGQHMVRAFLSAGCTVSALDINETRMQEIAPHERLHWQTADISSESSIEEAFAKARREHGVVATCLALASLDWSYLPHHESLCDMGLEQWRRTMRVNVEGTFLTARAWLRGIREYQRGQKEECFAAAAAAPSSGTRDTKGPGAAETSSSPSLLRNVGLIIIGSESGTFGAHGNADYAAGKSAVQYGLVQSLVRDVAAIHPQARVNAVAPGAVDTPQFRLECAESENQVWEDVVATTGMGKPVRMEDVARCCVFLASERWSGSVSGQVLSVNAGKDSVTPMVAK